MGTMAPVINPQTFKNRFPKWISAYHVEFKSAADLIHLGFTWSVSSQTNLILIK
jgi:hypothetical protein